jgi:hypothetical protein
MRTQRFPSAGERRKLSGRIIGGRGGQVLPASSDLGDGAAKGEPDYYLEWMLDTDFAPDVKEIRRAALKAVRLSAAAVCSASTRCVSM